MANLNNNTNNALYGDLCYHATAAASSLAAAASDRSTSRSQHHYLNSHHHSCYRRTVAENDNNNEEEEDVHRALRRVRTLSKDFYERDFERDYDRPSSPLRPASLPPPTTTHAHVIPNSPTPPPPPCYEYFPRHEDPHYRRPYDDAAWESWSVNAGRAERAERADHYRYREKNSDSYENHLYENMAQVSPYSEPKEYSHYRSRHLPLPDRFAHLNAPLLSGPYQHSTRWEDESVVHHPYLQRNHREPPKPRTTANHRPKPPPYKTIEVSPGTHLRLRGAEETYHAVQVDFFMPVSCFCCDENIFCIQNADFVLCPSCRVVSPISHSQTDSENDTTECPGDRSVGLGFTFQSLGEMQRDIELQRNFCS